MEYLTKIFHFIKESLEAKYGVGNYSIFLYHDLLLKYHNILANLPKDHLIVDYWTYETREKYPELNHIINAGYDFVVTPSVMDWTRFYPSENKSELNLINLTKYAYNYSSGQFKRSKFRGIITASWGDFLNQNLRDERLYNYVLCGDIAWNIDAWQDFPSETQTLTRLPQFRRSFSKYFFGIENEKFAAAEYNLRRVEVDNHLKMKGGPTMAFANLFTHPYQWNPHVQAINFPQVIIDMNDLITTCEELKEIATHNKDLLDSYVVSARLIKLYALKILHSKKALSKPLKKFSARGIQALIEDAKGVRDEFASIRTAYEQVWRHSW